MLLKRAHCVRIELNKFICVPVGRIVHGLWYLTDNESSIRCIFARESIHQDHKKQLRRIARNAMQCFYFYSRETAKHTIATCSC